MRAAIVYLRRRKKTRRMNWGNFSGVSLLRYWKLIAGMAMPRAMRTNVMMTAMETRDGESEGRLSMVAFGVKRQKNQPEDGD
jgi:hypothetical protein